MSEFVIVPLKKVGDIEFGMDRSKVREILGEYKEFRKNKFSRNTTDDFKICHVYYDINNKCEAVEIFEKVTLKINNTIIYPAAYKEVCNFLKELDEDAELEEDSCTSFKKAISIYAPGGEVESILIEAEGYFV
jgi:hypothetical protein